MDSQTIKKKPSKWVWKPPKIVGNIYLKVYTQRLAKVQCNLSKTVKEDRLCPTVYGMMTIW